MMHRRRQLGRNGGGVFGGGASHEYAILALHDLGRYGRDLFRFFAGTENNFRKSLSQRAVRIHLREAKVVDRLGTKSVQHRGLIDFAGFEPLQKLAGFLWCHRQGFNSSSMPTSRGNAPLTGKLP